VIGIERIGNETEKVRCPYCGNPVNAMKGKDARCQGIFFKVQESGMQKDI